MSDCFVYVIAQECGNPLEDKVFVKVGMSGSPAARLAQLQTGAPFKLYLQAAFKLPSRSFAQRVEQRYHAINAAWKTSGEWTLSFPYYSATELASYCVDIWIEDGHRIFDVARLCDDARIPCEVFAAAVADFITHPTLLAASD